MLSSYHIIYHTILTFFLQEWLECQKPLVKHSNQELFLQKSDVPYQSYR